MICVAYHLHILIYSVKEIELDNVSIYSAALIFFFKAPSFEQMDQSYQLYIFILTLTTLFTGKSIQDTIKCVESHVKAILL